MNNKIKSTYLNKYVCRLLNSDNIEESDLQKIKRLVINFNDLSENEKDKVMNDLKLFDNLKDISLTLFPITQEDINILKSINTLESITFDFCKLNCRLNGQFKNIVLNACTGIELAEMKKLKELKIIEASEELDLKDILRYRNVEELYILNCNVLNICEILKLENLKKLDIRGSNVEQNTITLLGGKIKVIYGKKYHPTGL